MGNVGINQCVDLCNKWCDNLGIERFDGNAATFQFDSHPDCDWIGVADGDPASGDILVWRVSPGLPFGHVSVFVKVVDDQHFQSFDQNWPLNSPCHLQQHNYYGLVGYLRPRMQDMTPEQATQLDDTHNKITEVWNLLRDGKHVSGNPRWIFDELDDAHNKVNEVWDIARVGQHDGSAPSWLHVELETIKALIAQIPQADTGAILARIDTLSKHLGVGSP